MKKIRYIMALVCVGVFGFLSSSCFLWGGYNKIMYEYFSNENNYREWTMTVKDFIWMDWDNNQATYSLYEDSEENDFKPLEYREYDYIYLILTVDEADKEYWGENYQYVAYRIFYENAKTLVENGMTKDVKKGDRVTVRATDWTYSDNRFLYIAEVKTESVCYLDIQTGLKNITAYMDGNRTLF
ncbi:MAG: hypothetical protein J6D30_01915 [Clostridia bacterium]|nr:hypothetical protein [Clostridia bacterium]